MRQQSIKTHNACLMLGVAVLGCAQLALVSGCDRTEIHSYSVPKELNDSPASSTQQTEPASPEVTWTLPSTWIEVETTNSMRIATFESGNGQQIAVTAFPGDVGGLVANVNRWRGQVGLDPADEASVNEGIEHLEGTGVIIVDIAGEKTRLIGSIIDVGDGQTWFAKAMGSSDTVEQVKAELIEFSKTFHIHDHAPSEPSPATQSVWEQPTQWTVQENVSSMLAAAYMAESGARITLTVLLGDGGGMLSNINRWRGQLGMPMMQSMADQQVKDLGNEAVFVDLVAPDDSGRMAAGIVPVGTQTLFFKLTGTPTQVQEELERFEAYINAEGLGKVAAP